MIPESQAELLKHIEQQCQAKLPAQDTEPTRLHLAMHYGVLSGGKRIRAQLIYRTGQLFGVDVDVLDTLVCAVEYIHCYSLIHDDLPCMDDADLRRGKPSCHKQFDVATAVLAGDALQGHAFYCLAQLHHHNPATVLNMISLLCEAIASTGMAGGQMIDLTSGSDVLTETQLRQLHELKTGKLLQACFLLPALYANVDEHTLSTISEIGALLGLAFQVQDDVLDVTASTEKLGKQSGIDAANEKTTFVTLMSVEKAKQLADDLFEQIQTLLSQLHGDKQGLQDLIKQIAIRDH